MDGGCAAAVYCAARHLSVVLVPTWFLSATTDAATNVAALPASQRRDGSQPGQPAVDGRFEDSAAMLVIPVTTTPTGKRPFTESAGRHEHRSQIFLALPHRSFRDW